MSGYPEKSNPFFADDDDESGFGGRGGGRYGGGGGYDSGGGYGAAGGAPMTREERLQQMKDNSMNNTLQSAQRAIASIYDSERMGVATAEELVHQGEQLDNIERTVDQVNQDTKTSQRHLNNIKSIFGGIKNWWSGGKEEKKQEQEKEREVPKSTQRLRNAIEEDRERNIHPALRLRCDDVSGFYEDQDLDSKFLSGGSAGRGLQTSQTGMEGHGYDGSMGARGGQQTYQSQKQRSTGLKEFDEQLEQNLDVMSGGMARLKNLAMGLGDEIERQNDQIERIQPKVQRATTTLEDQNRQMRRILNK